MATPYHLLKKRGALKGAQISFLRDTFLLRFVRTYVFLML